MAVHFKRSHELEAGKGDRINSTNPTNSKAALGELLQQGIVANLLANKIQSSLQNGKLSEESCKDLIQIHQNLTDEGNRRVADFQAKVRARSAGYLPK